MSASSDQEILREVRKLRESLNRFRVELKGELASMKEVLDAMTEDAKSTKKNTNYTHKDLKKISEEISQILFFVEHFSDYKIELKIRK